MRIAIPQNLLYKPLLQNVDVVCEQMGWRVHRASGEDCASLLLNNHVDLALISPLGYGRGVGKVDYRIISEPCISLIDYTAVAGIMFSENAQEIDTIGSRTPKEFLPVIGSLLMREKYEVADNPVVLAADFSTVDCLIEEYPLVGNSFPSQIALDIGEEWFDMIELPLPVGLWVYRTDAEIGNIAANVRAMASDTLTNVMVHESLNGETEYLAREGQINYQWSDEVEQGLDSVLRLFYYYQVLPELPAIKLLGRD
ncbi:MAG: hypothetical protein HYX66_08255 [Ignavibacteria bacterium]|nr:hypothetical protein [Ignavibacteria bacterium]